MLTIAKMLDHEEINTMSLVIVAQDRGHPRQSAQITITINIADVNDNPPVFERSVYKANVTENLSSKTPIVTIHATDRDIGKLPVRIDVLESLFIVHPISYVVHQFSKHCIIVVLHRSI